MKNNTENINNSLKKIKPKLSPKVSKWVRIFATCSSLILNPVEAIWNTIDTNRLSEEEYSEMMYSALKDELSFTINWFIQTIITENPELNERSLRNKELIILGNITSDYTDERWNPLLQVSIELSKEKIKSLEDIIDQLVYLLDEMYWEWYSSILTDWQEHNNRKLIIDISEFWEDSYRIRKLSIEDIKK